MKKQMLAERYQLETKLGQNAGRQTWLAQDISLSPPQPVVVKLLAFNPQMHWDELKLFEREAQVLQHLNHPRIPEYRDFFTIEKQFGEGLPWFGLVQDYIPGDSLQTLLEQGKRFTEAEVCQIAESILEIIIYLHELSPPVFHRDIKPSNLILSQDGQIYLVDFGAVQDRATAEGVTFTVVGTSGYAPPEQFFGKVVPASDLYALGATLIHLLTGIAPADLPQDQMRLQFSDCVNLSPHFSQWLERLTEPAPERRFTGARQALLSLKSGGDSGINSGYSSRDRVRYGRLAGLTLLQFIIASIALSLILPNFWGIRKTQPVDAKDDVSLMNRTQVRVRLET
jgi:serine/threonine protein kinase